MAIINRNGLLGGDRLRDCGDDARIWWPWFFTAANGYGRLELNYDRIVRDMFGAWKKPPISKSELRELFKDYHKHHLAYVYQSDGKVWAQFEVAYSPKHYTAEDRRSPAPPVEIESWREQYRLQKEAKAVNDLDGWEIIHAIDNKDTGKSRQVGAERGENPALDLIRVDEIREEKVKSVSSAASAEPIAGTLPLVNGTDYQVTKPEVQMWQELFPAVDVDQGFRSMKAWLIAHPENRKTPRGIKKFIQGWLERDHNRARPQAGAGNGKTAESAREQIRRVTAGMDEPDSGENQRLVSSVQS